MEGRIAVGLLGLLSALWAALVAGEPRAVLAPAGEPARELAELEDRFARDPTDAQLARELATRYLRLERPALTVAVVRASRELVADPLLSLRLSQAYERSGRLPDALRTARLSLMRCHRALGTTAVSMLTQTPAFACDERVLAAIERQHEALSQMVRWGVQDPRYDRRARLAHALSERSARIASMSAAAF